MYTDKAWTATKQYIRDKNALIFSLVNKSNQPVKIKCTDPKHAIYSNPKRGPTFGFGIKNKGHDFCIKHNSNAYFHPRLNKSCYSGLGHSYIYPNYLEGSDSKDSKWFLVSSRRFLTYEIEVYCKI